MAMKINKDTYVGDTGKQLKDISTNAYNISLAQRLAEKCVITVNYPEHNIQHTAWDTKNITHNPGFNGVYNNQNDVIIENGYVKINSNKYGYMLVSASATFGAFEFTNFQGDVQLAITKNGTVIHDCYGYSVSNEYWHEITTSPVLLSCAKGDTIGIAMGGSLNGECCVLVGRLYIELFN